MKTNTLRMESSNPEGLLNRGSCEMTKYSKNTNWEKSTVDCKDA